MGIEIFKRSSNNKWLHRHRNCNCSLVAYWLMQSKGEARKYTHGIVSQAEIYNELMADSRKHH